MDNIVRLPTRWGLAGNSGSGSSIALKEDRETEETETDGQEQREKDHERTAKYAFLAAAIKGRDQPGPSYPRTGLKTSPQTLLLMQPVRTLGKVMPKPAAPHKSMPSLWPMGTLEDRLSPGMPWHPWGGPHFPDLESGRSTGTPWHLWRNPHFSPEPQPNPTKVVPMTGPGFQPLSPCPEHELGT